MEAKMKDLRKGEVIMLPFVVMDACGQAGIIRLAVNTRELGDNSEATIMMQSPDLLVELTRDLIVPGDVVVWEAYGKTSHGWGRVLGEHGKWLIVKLYDMLANDDAPTFVWKANAKRNPKLTEERDALHAELQIERVNREQA